MNVIFGSYWGNNMKTQQERDKWDGQYSNSIIISQMSSQQSGFKSQKLIDDLDELSTSADSFIQTQKKSLLGETHLLFSKALHKGLEHHEIATNVSKSIFTSDKVLKLVSAVLKVFRSYGLTDRLKACQKLGGEIGQVRRLLRVDRLFMLVKEFSAFARKKQTGLSEKMMMIFKIMILLEDLTDLRAFLIQLKLVEGERLLGELRKKVALFYFLECLGWFIYHAKEFYKSRTEQDEYKNKMAMLKYVLDGLLAHNELPRKLFQIQPRNAALLAIASAALNLYLVWK